ncbi:MAG: branched-chain amino acid ABC transporter permease [Burkholderiaceae bacterium]
MEFTIQFMSGLAVGCIYALVAVGFSMIYRALGLVNFAQADIMMLGAFIGYALLQFQPNMPFFLVLIIAPVLTAVVGYLIERIAFRGAVKRKADQIYLVLLTLGVGIVLSNAARLIWGANPVVYNTPLVHEIYQVGAYPLPAVYLYIAVTMFVLLIGLQWFFSKTWIGLAVRAAADDRDTASTMGISVTLASGVSFALASGTGALAGVLYAPITFASFDMGIIGVKAFAAAIIGTLGSIPGAVIGGLIIGLGETFGGQWISNAYMDSIAFAIMIAILLVRPTGLMSKGDRV